MVATPSRLSNNEADEASVIDNPNISRTGPAIPPVATTTASQGKSVSFSGDSVVASDAAARISRKIDRPIPAPRYSIPASSHGFTEPSSNLENGVDAPKRTAAPSASGTPGNQTLRLSDTVSSCSLGKSTNTPRSGRCATGAVLLATAARVNVESYHN